MQMSEENGWGEAGRWTSLLRSAAVLPNFPKQGWPFVRAKDDDGWLCW